MSRRVGVIVYLDPLGAATLGRMIRRGVAVRPPSRRRSRPCPLPPSTPAMPTWSWPRLLDETLVVMCGEMGRTPKVSPITPGGNNASGEVFTPGRHHWDDVFLY